MNREQSSLRCYKRLESHQRFHHDMIYHVNMRSGFARLEQNVPGRSMRLQNLHPIFSFSLSLVSRVSRPSLGASETLNGPSSSTPSGSRGRFRATVSHNNKAPMVMILRSKCDQLLSVSHLQSTMHLTLPRDEKETIRFQISRFSKRP